MQRMWRQMFVAVVAMLAVTGFASAQNAQPNPLPALPKQSIVPVAGTDYVRGSGGCSNCGSGNGPVAQTLHQPAVPFAQYGPTDRHGCGNFKSDLGFIFGNCKSYFNPCNPLPCDGGRGRFGSRNPCPIQPYGTPYGAGANGCKYDTYLNH